MRASVRTAKKKKKVQGGDVSGGERQQDRRGSTWWTAGLGSHGFKLRKRLQSQSHPFILSGADAANQTLLKFNLPKAPVDPTFTSLSSAFPPPITPPPTALFHLFSFIPRSYSCHIFSAPNLFLSIVLLRHSSLLLCYVSFPSW